MAVIQERDRATITRLFEENLVNPVQMVYFTLPNVDPWRFSGNLGEDGTIGGVVASAQGGVPVTFRRADGAR